MTMKFAFSDAATGEILAVVQDASQVALEAGNSPAIIAKHYRELVTGQDADQWFSIEPPEGWQAPLVQWNRAQRELRLTTRN